MGRIWIKKLIGNTLKFIESHPCLKRLRRYDSRTRSWKVVEETINLAAIKWFSGPSDVELNMEDLYLKLKSQIKLNWLDYFLEKIASKNASSCCEGIDKPDYVCSRTAMVGFTDSGEQIPGHTETFTEE